MRTKTIYTRWMAYELRKLGHNPVTIQPNPHKPEFDVWVFQDTERLEEDMTKITKDAKKKNKEKNKDERCKQSKNDCDRGERTALGGQARQLGAFLWQLQKSMNQQLMRQ